MKVKYVLWDGKRLSKRTYYCNVPIQMHGLSEKVRKNCLIGVGTFAGSKEKLIAILAKNVEVARPELLKEIEKFVEEYKEEG